jgi:5-methylcytosine-specific restriction endonuclease McrA
MNLHTVCECCGIVESRELHHIVTRSTGGQDEDWNYLALCTVCHHTFHYLGRKSFAARYPHLADKIKEAVIRQGRKW